MMNAYANFVRGFETLRVINDIEEHRRTGKTFKYMYNLETFARVALEIFEEDVPNVLREKIEIKESELEK